MFVVMKINPDHIREAEGILIGGAEFDPERIEFINFMDTVDLLAVPGSGKTTALLAKLYCMAKQMPFPDNAGILVLAHTNHAIQEIEKVLKPICPQLFSYPNFVGTVQSFANKFIANQANFDLYGSYIRKNDDEISENELLNEFYKIGYTSKLNGFIFNQIYSQYSKIKVEDLEKNCALSKSEAKQQLILLKKNKILNKNGTCNYSELKKISSGDIDIVKTFLRFIHNFAINKVKDEKQTYCLRYNIDFNNRKFKSKSGDLSFDSNSGKELLGYFEEALKKGILRFRDSFSIAQYYIGIQKVLIEILQNRFHYVFIDEMQDLDQDQVNLVDDIFFSGNSRTVIQRIGDKNQAIYSSKSLGGEVVWKTRYEIDAEKFERNLSLNNSHRLTPTIAKLIDGFVLNRDEGYEVVGTSGNTDIAPYLLVYNDEGDANKLKEKFIELIKYHQLEQNAKNLGHGFHIVGWTTDKDEGSNKWYLRKLYPEYSKESKQNKDDFNCLRKYVFLFDQDKNTFESIRKSILNGIIRVLRIEQIYFDSDSKKHFRKSSFIQLVKNKGDEFYQDFKQKLFNWCFSIITLKNYEEIFIEFSDYVTNDLIDIISDFKVLKSTDFIKRPFDFIVSDLQIKNNQEQNQLEIKLGSVHSVKGQTHCATMYVETDYYFCETSKLNVMIESGTKNKEPVYGNNPLFFQEQNFSHLGKVRSNETLKMMYVGFSRPTHLLCFAVRKLNVGKDIQKYKNSGWDVRFI